MNAIWTETMDTDPREMVKRRCEEESRQAHGQA
jgi:hypothetical protein